MKRILWVSLTLISLLSVACKRDAAGTKEKLIGRWEITEAYRNDRLTESLAELYFEFFADGKMQTNITGNPEQATYSLRSDKISQRDSSIDADYTLEEITDSTMIMSTTLRNFSFRFLLHKATPPVK